jgi:hypothetical protein
MSKLRQLLNVPAVPICTVIVVLIRSFSYNSYNEKGPLGSSPSVALLLYRRKRKEHDPVAVYAGWIAWVDPTRGDDDGRFARSARYVRDKECQSACRPRSSHQVPHLYTGKCTERTLRCSFVRSGAVLYAKVQFELQSVRGNHVTYALELNLFRLIASRLF